MESSETRVKVYGTSEPVQVLRSISVGALSFLYSPEGLRRIAWQGTELVRALAWPIRDENWGTYPPEILEDIVDESDGFEARLRFLVGDGGLICELHIRASGEGELKADLTMTPKGPAFSTNRAGFSVLHPIKGVAGADLRVTHSEGSVEQTRFPELIRPDQPVKDISGLSYGIGGQSVAIVFEGEVFEMEDQRNWSDASFKTYCVPLVHPFTYDITGPIRQSVQMTFSGTPAQPEGRSREQSLVMEPSSARAPKVGLALEAGWLPRAATTVPPVGTHALLRTGPDGDGLDQVAAFARQFTSVDLEIVLPDDMDVADGLGRVAEALTAHDIVPAHVIALRECYLGSHQPVGPWPDGPTPNDSLDCVRAAFPQSKVGGGMLTNFTELNRCRPDTTRCDYVTHGLTPLVHAGDDMSVLETLETLPQIFMSAQAQAKERPYRLGLASIGMRSNPYGAAVAENPKQVRRTMAHVDPRHRGLFGAAFAVGILAATEGSAVEAMCLGAPAGPFGLAVEPADYPQEGYDGQGRSVFPLYHVVKAAAAMAGHARLALHGLPTGIAGFGAVIGSSSRILLANLGDTPRQVPLGGQGRFVRLDVESFDAATMSADWLDTAQRTTSSAVDLPPFSVAFLETEKP